MDAPAGQVWGTEHLWEPERMEPSPYRDALDRGVHKKRAIRIWKRVDHEDGYSTLWLSMWHEDGSRMHRLGMTSLTHSFNEAAKAERMAREIMEPWS